MNVLVVQHLVTLSEATRIMRLFKQKKHSGMGYYFELQNLGAPMSAAVELPGLELYRDTGRGMTNRAAFWCENAYILRVHREVPGR